MRFLYVFHLWEKNYNAFLQYKKENQELSSLVEKERPLLLKQKGQTYKR